MSRRNREALDAARTVIEQAPTIASVVAREWQQFRAEEDDDEPCSRLARAAEFGVAMSRALDPVIVLPEPADTALDVVVALVATGIALLCTTATAPARYEDAELVERAIRRHARREERRATRRMRRGR